MSALDGCPGPKQARITNLCLATRIPWQHWSVIIIQVPWESYAVPFPSGLNVTKLLGLTWSRSQLARSLAAQLQHSSAPAAQQRGTVDVTPQSLPSIGTMFQKIHTTERSCQWLRQKVTHKPLICCGQAKWRGSGALSSACAFPAPTGGGAVSQPLLALTLTISNGTKQVDWTCFGHREDPNWRQ